MLQQQALAAQSSYLSPVSTVAALQMQQMAALSANGIIAAPITPSSGDHHRHHTAQLPVLQEPGPNDIIIWLPYNIQTTQTDVKEWIRKSLCVLKVYFVKNKGRH